MTRPKNFLLIISILLSFSYSTAMDSPNPYTGNTGQETVRRSIGEVLLKIKTRENIQVRLEDGSLFQE